MTRGRRSAGQAPVVQCTSPLCNSLDVEVGELIDVSAFEAAGDAWQATGRAKILYCSHGKCRTCGRIFDLIRREIPVLYPDLTCPSCDSRERLTYQVTAVRREDSSFEFAVTIGCKRCDRWKLFRKVLSALARIESIEIKLTGIRLQMKPAGS